MTNLSKANLFPSVGTLQFLGWNHSIVQYPNINNTMNKTLFSIIFALLTLGAGAFSTAHAQSSGDLYQGLTRGMPDGRTVIPYGLEVTFDKT